MGGERFAFIDLDKEAVTGAEGDHFQKVHEDQNPKIGHHDAGAVGKRQFVVGEFLLRPIGEWEGEQEIGNPEGEEQSILDDPVPGLSEETVHVGGELSASVDR